MFALAPRSGYGENTRVHGVGDGAPWIARQMAVVFPGQSFLLDRYHLLEHLHEGASLLVEGAKTCPRLDREAWVNEQVSRGEPH